MDYELVAFDLDGTLVDDTIFIWRTLHEKFGVEEEAEEQTERYRNGEVSYYEWAKHDEYLWKQAGASREELVEEIEKLRLMPGAMEVLKELKAEGRKIAIISGSLDLVVDTLIPDHEKYVDHMLINEVKFNEDGSVKEVVPTEFDHEHKLTGLKQLCEMEGTALDDAFFVGDHFNDVHIAREAGFSIAFNCKSDELEEVSDEVIEEKDLRKILPHLQ